MAHARAARRGRPLHRVVRRQAAVHRRRQDLRQSGQGRAVDQGRQRDPFRHDLDHAARLSGGGMMAYAMKPLACDPTRIKGMSEKLIASHYENNYGGAVTRLTTITAQLAELDFSKAPGF